MELFIEQRVVEQLGLSKETYNQSLEDFVLCQINWYIRERNQDNKSSPSPVQEVISWTDCDHLRPLLSSPEVSEDNIKPTFGTTLILTS